MRNPFSNANVGRSRTSRTRSILTSASALALVAGLGFIATTSASAASLSPHAAPAAPCNVSISGGGTIVPGEPLIVGVVAGTTQVTFDCNDSSGATVAAEASLLAAISSSNVIPNSEADTNALGTFVASATDTGCPAAAAGSCTLATFNVPSSFAAAGDKNGTCPPTQAQINAGIFGCALVVANATEAQVLGAEYLIQYASQTTAPAAPTIAPLQASGSAGSEVSVTDAAGSTGYWWGSSLEAVQALNAGSAGVPAPATCTPGAYGNAPSAYLVDTWFITGTTTAIGGGPATGVTISNDCYTGAMLNNPVLSGNIAVPPTVTAGAAYTVYLCEVNTTPYPGNDSKSAQNCGSASPFIDASFSFNAVAKSISQNLPVANSVASTSSSTFKDQLTGSGNNGSIAYTQTAGSPSLVVSSSGAITTSGTLAPGSYTASGTTGDASGDTGTFTYTLVVTGTTPPPVTKPAPKATRVDGFAVPGRTVIITILGKNFTSGARVIGHAGTVVSVVKDAASKLVVRVREVAHAKAGTYKFIIQFASGKRTSVSYRVK